jgi:hypothetical protein
MSSPRSASQRSCCTSATTGAVPLEEGSTSPITSRGRSSSSFPGTDHWPWIGQEKAVEEIQEFLTGMRDSAEPDRAMVAVMFVDIVDIVDSAKRAAKLGDRRWADLLESFYAVAKRALDGSRGLRRTSLAPAFGVAHHPARMSGIFGSSGKTANPAGTMGSLVGVIGRRSARCDQRIWRS